jgi:hypothetical protein
MPGSVYAITSNDTLTLNGNVFTDQADDDVSVINFPNELANLKTGKNSNAVIAQNANGNNATLTLRLIRGSADDAFMMGLLSAQQGSFPSVMLLQGTFVKQIGDGSGNITADTYTLQGGFFARNVDGKENVSGDVNQAVAVYNLKFASATRTIG